MSEIICTACGHEAKQHSAVSGGNFMQGCEALLGNPVHTCLCELSQSEVEYNAQLAVVTAQRDVLLAAAKAVVAASNSEAASGGEMWWAETVSPTVDALEAAIAATEAGAK